MTAQVDITGKRFAHFDIEPAHHHFYPWSMTLKKLTASRSEDLACYITLRMKSLASSLTTGCSGNFRSTRTMRRYVS